MLKTHYRRFEVHKSVLTSGSEYFEKCLNGDFMDAIERIIRFNDIPCYRFDIYLKACYTKFLASEQNL